jgi:hypothetical protein
MRLIALPPLALVLENGEDPGRNDQQREDESKTTKLILLLPPHFHMEAIIAASTVSSTGSVAKVW